MPISPPATSSPAFGHSSVSGRTFASVLTSTTALFCAALLLVTGCASSGGSKGKKKRTVLMTEYDDARVGAEHSVGIEAQMGVLGDPKYDSYVSEIGRKLLRGVPRRGFNYQFKVVDQEQPNAFALPGGYIYVSRGLLALANNEDELACVIGHEITHAAHRHGATQQAAVARTIGFGWQKQAKIASYGREMEVDADKGGQILAAAAGYDPIGMSTFLNNLGQSERLAIGYTRGAGFFDTHPGTQARAATNAVRAREIRWKRDPSLGDTRASLLRVTDGLPVGQRPEAGVFRGSLFLHPDLNFKLAFPQGWRLSNTNQAVGAVTRRGDAVVMLRADMPAGDPQEMAEAWVEKNSEQAKLKVRESKPVRIGDIDAWRMLVEASGGGMRLASYITFIPYSGATWSVTGMSRASDAKKYLGRTLSTARSFGPLSNEERNSFTAEKMRITVARPGEDLNSLGGRTGNSWSVADTAIYNGVFIDHRYEGGEQVKISKTERYVPPPLAQ